VKNEASLGLLNIGQSCIIAAAVTLLMILGRSRVWRRLDGRRSGARQRPLDPALNSAHFLGMVYRGIKQALPTWIACFRLLTQDREIQDRPVQRRCPL